MVGLFFMNYRYILISIIFNLCLSEVDFCSQLSQELAPDNETMISPTGSKNSLFDESGELFEDDLVFDPDVFLTQESVRLWLALLDIQSDELNQDVIHEDYFIVPDDIGANQNTIQELEDFCYRSSQESFDFINDAHA